MPTRTTTASRRRVDNNDFSRIDEFDKRGNYEPAGFERRHIFNFN